MDQPLSPIVLGSRSPQRRELLALLVGAERVVVRPPAHPAEPGFDDDGDLQTIERRLFNIAETKNADVTAQLHKDGILEAAVAVVTADTVIVGFHSDGRPAVLGQPPVDGDWKRTVRDWFETFYLGRTHRALTAVCITAAHGRRVQRVVSTEVSFRADGGDWLDWYLRTGEPLGKAGGYGLQGAGGLFVERIDGSPSNVIGLPLRETAQMLAGMGVDFPPR